MNIINRIVENAFAPITKGLYFVGIFKGMGDTKTPTFYQVYNIKDDKVSLKQMHVDRKGDRSGTMTPTGGKWLSVDIPGKIVNNTTIKSPVGKLTKWDGKPIPYDDDAY